LQGAHHTGWQNRTALRIFAPSFADGRTMAKSTEHRWVVDGIEEGMARVEEGERMLTLPIHLLPAGVREGQILRVTRSAETKESVTLVVAVDAEATARALADSRAATERAMAASKKRDRGGDVAL